MHTSSAGKKNSNTFRGPKKACYPEKKKYPAYNTSLIRVTAKLVPVPNHQHTSQSQMVQPNRNIFSRRFSAEIWDQIEK